MRQELGKRNPLTTLELGEVILHKHTMKGKCNPLTTPELGEAILHDNTRNPERIEQRIEWMSKQSLCQILIDLCTDRPSWQNLQKEERQIQNQINQTTNRMDKRQSLCQILIDLCTDRPSWQSLPKEE